MSRIRDSGKGERVPVICYRPIRFSAAKEERIELINEVVRDYQGQGLRLTLRQLYYVLVSQNAIANREQEYKNLGGLLSDARLAGMVDWDAVEDRTRNLRGYDTFDSTRGVISEAEARYRVDWWADQENRVEIWVEKEALAGVVGRTADRLRCDYFACRGYVSMSEMWAAAVRCVGYARNGQTPIIIHLGDHDPSGLDMTRDNRERLEMFLARHGVYELQVERIALNIDQVRHYNPPANPAKSTDSRFRGYSDEFGDESWELDALNPRVLDALIEERVLSYRTDAPAMERRQQAEARDRIALRLAGDHWDDLRGHMADYYRDEFESALQEVGDEPADGEEE